MDVDPCFKVNDVALMVEGSIALLKSAVIFWLRATPAATNGTEAGDERLVIGMVLKFVPRKRNPTIATEVSEVMRRLPSKSSGSSGTSENSSLMNFETC